MEEAMKEMTPEGYVFEYKRWHSGVHAVITLDGERRLHSRITAEELPLWVNGLGKGIRTLIMEDDRFYTEIDPKNEFVYIEFGDHELPRARVGVNLTSAFAKKIADDLEDMALNKRILKPGT